MFNSLENFTWWWMVKLSIPSCDDCLSGWQVQIPRPSAAYRSRREFQQLTPLWTRTQIQTSSSATCTRQRWCSSSSPQRAPVSLFVWHFSIPTRTTSRTILPARPARLVLRPSVYLLPYLLLWIHLQQKFCLHWQKIFFWFFFHFNYFIMYITD